MNPTDRRTAPPSGGDDRGSTFEPDAVLDDLWERGERPDVHSFLASWPGEGLSLEGLLSVLRIDQRRRWLTGDRVDLHSYRRNFPVLDQNSEALFELLYHELLIREDLGEHPDSGEYSRQFPGLADRLELQLQVHEALSGEHEIEPVVPLVTDEPSELPGPRPLPVIPGYDVIEEIGRGGMGIVYRARQLCPERDVALKMILDGRFASDLELRRFENEAEAVAALDHPNIVPILAVGHHQRLRYFSMRLLTGGSLASVQKRLTGDPRAVARLMVAVAGAVHHAHQRGVLHRDLKPANILLDESGRPYVTDFGLARRASTAPALTEAGAVVGSPGFMAPEQALGDPTAITTATDVYGLGALLYALLTGSPPFAGHSTDETLTRLKNVSPESPSRLNRTVPRALEVVCMKCLEKEPARRYPSAEAFADDLGRWLAGEPIVARPPSILTRLWLWIRRRPTHAALTAALAAAIIAGNALGAARWAWAQADARLIQLKKERTLLSDKNDELARTNRELARARDRERDAALRARERFVLALAIVDDTFYGFGENSIARVPGTEASRQKAFRRIIDQYQKIQEALVNDPQPEARSRLATSYARLAEMSGEVGVQDTSLFAMKKALELRRQICQQSGGAPAPRLDEANALRQVGGYQLKYRQPREALASFQGSYDLLEQLVADDPDNGPARIAMASALRYIAAIQLGNNQRAEALDTYDRLLKTNEAILEHDPRSHASRFNQALGFMVVGFALRTAGRTADSRARLERARRDFDTLVRESPGDAIATDRLIDCNMGLADLYLLENRPVLALDAGLRACTAAEMLAQRFGTNARNLDRRAATYWLAFLKFQRHERLGRLALARAIHLYRNLVSEYPGVDRFREAFAGCLFRRGFDALNHAQPVIAEPALREAADHYDILARSKPDDAAYGRAADSRILQGLALAIMGRRRRALSLIDPIGSTMAMMKSARSNVSYNQGCLFARLSTGAADPADREELCRSALTSLRTAARAGYCNVTAARRDPDLMPLRGRADFESFLLDLAFPADPFTPAHLPRAH